MAGASSRTLVSTPPREEENTGEGLLHNDSFHSWKHLEGIKASWTGFWESRLNDVQVTSGFLNGLYDTLTREQTQPQG